MKPEEITDVIERAYPLSSQEEWDNSGYQIRIWDEAASKEEDVSYGLDADADISYGLGADTGGKESGLTSDGPCVLVALDVTKEVVEEAVRKGAKLIVTHHPLFFGGLKAIDTREGVGRYAAELIKNGISVYSCHTPFDKGPGGNNDYLAEVMHLRNVASMAGSEGGFCRTGFTEEEYTAEDFIRLLCKRLDLKPDTVRLTGRPDRPVRKVGLCTGAGSDFIEDAKKEGCDMFVTGDVKYHDAMKARDMDLLLLDIGHFGSEKIFKENMAAFLTENTDGDVMMARSETDPFTVLSSAGDGPAEERGGPESGGAWNEK